MQCHALVSRIGATLSDSCTGRSSRAPLLLPYLGVGSLCASSRCLLAASGTCRVESWLAVFYAMLRSSVSAEKESLTHPHRLATAPAVTHGKRGLLPLPFGCDFG